MVRVIQLKEKHDCEHLLGKFIDHDSYDFVANEDVDVYKPAPKMGKPFQDERNVLLKFRKGVFSKESAEKAYKGLRSGATVSDNRGLAAGTSEKTQYQHLPSGEIGARKWVTNREREILLYFIDGSPSSIEGDDAQKIYDETSNNPIETKGGCKTLYNNTEVAIKGGSVWIVKYAKDIDFEKWFDKTKKKTPQERKIAAIDLVHKHISDTVYGEAVNSGVGGYMDRYPRIPFCRETSWTASHMNEFQSAFPLFEQANETYKKCLPNRWQGQKEEADKLQGGKDWLIGDTIYTTVTINKQFRTACHRDVGDLCEGEHLDNPKGFSNLTVVSNGKSFDGFYLCFPEYRVAANIQPGDLIMMDAHQIHGNVPIISCEEGFERMSIVMYFREAMLGCGTKQIEDLRRKFTYQRRDDLEHKDRPKAKREDGPNVRWNGVSPSMFESVEWKNYLYNNGFPEEAEKVMKSGAKLDL